jgi:hypothetical protein
MVRSHGTDDPQLALERRATAGHEAVTGSRAPVIELAPGLVRLPDRANGKLYGQTVYSFGPNICGTGEISSGAHA